MTSYTFILMASKKTDVYAADIESSVAAFHAAGTKVEVIFESDKKLPITNAFIQILSPTESISPCFLQRAIVTSAGEWCICVSPETYLTSAADIIAAIRTHSDAVVLVPTVSGAFEKKLGLRRLVNTPYVALKKTYAIDHINEYSSIVKLIRATDKDLRLTLLYDSKIIASAPIVTKVAFWRPYVEIARRDVRKIIRVTKAYYQRKKAERLSRNVLRVHYSDDIPVFIICRDRVGPLRKLVHWLESEGLNNIYFIDNASTYPPLLAYFESTKYTVVRLNSNAGHTAPWREGIVQLYAAGKPFIVTDPDVIPSKNAHGAVKFFADLLNRHLERRKVGFGLRIDNLPDHYELKDHVIAWEKQFWVSKVEADVFDAEIDTTFALYRPGTPYVLGPGLRTGGKYVAEHEPWYVNSKDIPDEILYYREHADKVVGSWGVVSADATETYNKHLLSGK